MSKYYEKHKNVRALNLLMGPVLFLLCLLLPHSVFTTAASRGAVGTVAWMAYWWVSGPIDFAITGFLPIAVNAFLQMADMADVIANYADEIVLLLLGASILTAVWEMTGLDKRIASWFLLFIGNSLRKQVVFWFILTTLLSSILPNAVVCAAITPIAVSMLHYIGIHDIGENKLGSMILLTIAYGTGIGGLGTPLGGAMNLVTVSYLEDLTGKEYIYMHWVIRFLPLMIVLVVVNILYLLFFCGKDETLGGSREYFEMQYRAMGKMKPGEKWGLGLFAVAAILSFSRQLYQNLLPNLKPAYVFLICAIIAFIVTKSDGSRLIEWKTAEKRVIWELMYVYAGGLAAGTLIEKSGAAKALGTAIASMNLNGGFVTVLVIVAVTVLLSDVTSATATAGVSIPIIINLMKGMGVNPIPYVYIASIGINVSYMLPTSIRAIPVGYGLKPKYMFKKGVVLTLLTIAAMSVAAWLLLKYWPAFSEA
ncbi:MAG: SLC13 family permease [Eubacterium sp.]